MASQGCEGGLSILEIRNNFKGEDFKRGDPSPPAALPPKGRGGTAALRFANW